MHNHEFIDFLVDNKHSKHININYCIFYFAITCLTVTYKLF
jgi:hypothetical protein